MLIGEVWQRGEFVLLWGLVASALMSLVLEACRHFGFSRLSPPFLLGTAFTGNRRKAELLGVIFYFLGGWLFAFFYALLFQSLEMANWWLGGLIGLLHALVLLGLMPLAPSLHPHMASPYDGPEAKRRIEPPGFLATNYGRATPLALIAAQLLYGIILGANYPI